MDSIDPLRTFSPTSEAGFASVSANPQPKDNLVLGIDLTWNALNGRLNVSYNNALSLYANDISGGPLMLNWSLWPGCGATRADARASEALCSQSPASPVTF